LEHIRPKWGKYVQRMQSLACQQQGYALIHTTVLVDESGEPVYWMQPRLETIEPKRDAKEFVDQMLGMLERSNNS